MQPRPSPAPSSARARTSFQSVSMGSISSRDPTRSREPRGDSGSAPAANDGPDLLSCGGDGNAHEPLDCHLREQGVPPLTVVHSRWSARPDVVKGLLPPSAGRARGYAVWLRGLQGWACVRHRWRWASRFVPISQLLRGRGARTHRQQRSPSRCTDLQAQATSLAQPAAGGSATRR